MVIVRSTDIDWIIDWLLITHHQHKNAVLPGDGMENVGNQCSMTSQMHEHSISKNELKYKALNQPYCKLRIFCKFRRVIDWCKNKKGGDNYSKWCRWSIKSTRVSSALPFFSNYLKIGFYLDNIDLI